MTATQHTPTPWTLVVNKDRRNVWGTPAWDGRMPEVIGADGHVIADIRWNGKNQERGVYNAETIVRAVNAHDDLVAALKVGLACVEAEGNGKCSPTAWWKFEQTARAALAKAKGDVP